MKYIVFLVLSLSYFTSQAQDTVYVENQRDPRYLEYLDSIRAYQISYSVAKNIADSVAGMLGSRTLDAYFLGAFTGSTERSEGYYYDMERDMPVTIGHVNSIYRGMKNEEKFPWKYLESQYRRLDSIKLQPMGIMQGAELPNVYVYAKPHTTYIFRSVKRFTVVGQIIKFDMSDGGKTKKPYIEKLYYIQIDRGNPKVDSIEKLDPVTKKHLNF
ncbi:MAG TPA: hypothetical protein VK154_10565 [Chitinophagales bacterium]|nr:hypothetical protein [Chitinophagales bacterium]